MLTRPGTATGPVGRAGAPAVVAGMLHSSRGGLPTFRGTPTCDARPGRINNLSTYLLHIEITSDSHRNFRTAAERLDRDRRPVERGRGGGEMRCALRRSAPKGEEGGPSLVRSPLFQAPLHACERAISDRCRPPQAAHVSGWKLGPDPYRWYCCSFAHSFCTCPRSTTSRPVPLGHF